MDVQWEFYNIRIQSFIDYLSPFMCFGLVEEVAIAKSPYCKTSANIDSDSASFFELELYIPQNFASPEFDDFR